MMRNEASHLQSQATRCRSLAASTLDLRAADLLREVADEYQALARKVILNRS
jgi:hypothetical protein